MELINKDTILKEISLFAGLSRSQRNLIKEKSSLAQYKKGEIVYREGSSADAFYCVVLGRAVIYTVDSYGKETILEYLHRGKYFGIISLLTGEPHSVTAQALNDCLLLMIKKEDFNFILKEAPQLAIDLSQTLSRRLKNKDIHQKTIFESTIISAFSSYAQAGKTTYVLNLALSLTKETHKAAIILDIMPLDRTHSLPAKLEISSLPPPIIDLSCPLADYARIREGILKNKFGIDLICLFYNPEDASCVNKLVGIISFLINDYHYIILDLPSNMDQCIFSILNQSDLIQILTSPEPVDLKRTHNLIKRLKADFNFPEAKIKVIINEYKLAKINHQQQLELLGHEIFATLPKIELAASERLVLDGPACEYAKAMRRIARQLSEFLVGLALGVGVGYGFCHIGVLKVIEEEKIPIDVISGASIGAVIAALWATGKTAQEILEITQEFKEQKFVWRLVDFTLPTLGFIKGNKLYRFLKKHIGNKTFYDIKLPLKIVASDVRRKESHILDKGSLVDALMLSCAMPGVFRPFSSKEGLLFDGGIINPLPTEPLFKMGVKKIIAVNVTPSREDMLSQYEKIKKQIASTYDEVKKKKWFSLKAYFKDKFKINILDIIFSSIEVMQSEIAQKEAQLADVVLHPDTRGLHWLELHRAEDFARRGEEETRRQLDKIWQIINE